MSSKTILLLFILLLIGYPVQAQKVKSDREHIELKGAVKTIRWERAELVNKANKLEEKKRVLLYESSYDEKGNLTATNIRSTSNGQLIKSVFVKDKTGNRIEIIAYGKAVNPAFLINKNGGLTRTDGMLQANWKIQYDNDGNRIEEIVERTGGYKSKRVYSYDASGNVQERTSCNDEEPCYKTEFVRDSNGNITEMTEYKNKNSPSRREFYSYEFDAKGNWIKRITSKQVIKEGKSHLELVEVTYRTISYY